ncbi:hypothetical protein [Microbacterium sp. NIBRBAC000506063]|uniref:hypothetical protein n=1 Tax=Microbacterium sp. NIBRBAC000506063 TaxID=2734618 RepID=UPI001BB7B6A4|nr:hypothetical protein [Microbacterium sp. NIBRBAC000506063]QTV79392.1 hypothetical protein KAE78_10575 [Microbacterium sp. NIBRBAC000506063]
MSLTVRSVATGLALGFSLYFVARGMWWIEQPLVPPLLLGALALYLGIMVTATLVDDDGQRRMPLWVTIAVVAVAVAIPTMVSLAFTPVSRLAPFATWYIGGVGLLGVVCVVRRRPICGWAVLLSLIVSSMAWMGPGNALRLGLVGSVVWMVVAQLLVWMWARAVRDTERLAGIQQQVSSWHAAQQVRQRERRRRVQYALAVAGPVLSRVVTTGGALDEQERMQARLAEGQLRDELRGGDLLNDEVRLAIDAVRRSGGTVTVLDEGGLEGVPEQRRAQIRDELAAALHGAGSLRVIIRAARHPQTALTVVGRAGGGAYADDDAVELWLEIARDAASDTHD